MKRKRNGIDATQQTIGQGSILITIITFSQNTRDLRIVHKRTYVQTTTKILLLVVIKLLAYKCLYTYYTHNI
jgi:hypothetical protein